MFWTLLFAQRTEEVGVLGHLAPVKKMGTLAWLYNEVTDAVAKSTAVVALYRTYLEWVPFSGGRGIDTTGQIIVAAVSGAALAAVLCIRCLHMHKGDYRHLK
jgi:hypothetical protein